MDGWRLQTEPNDAAQDTLRDPDRGRFGNQMKTREQIHTAFSLIIGVFCFIDVAMVYFVMIPHQGDAGILHFIAAIFAVLGLVLTATSLVNLKLQELNFAASVVQIAFLLPLLPFGTALGIWGIWLLRKDRRNGVANHTSDGIRQPAYGSPKPSM